MKIQDKHSEFLRDIIDDEEEGNILTLEQLKFRLEDEFPEDFPNQEAISEAAIKYHLDNTLELTLKRTKAIEERQLDENTINQRKEYAQKVLTGHTNYLENCIFVDECGFNTCMVPGSARSKKGKRAHVLTKTKRAMNISIIGALGTERIESFTAKMVPGETSAAIFGEFTEDLFKKLEETYLGQSLLVLMFIVTQNLKVRETTCLFLSIFAYSKRR